MRIEESQPEKAAIAIDVGTDPFATIKAAAKAAGLSVPVTRALLKRFKVQHKPLADEIRRYKTEDLIGVLEDRLALTLQYLDDYTLSTASASTLSITSGILIDKIQLLKGLPTARVSHEDSRNMNELIGELIKEGKRRGLELDT